MLDFLLGQSRQKSPVPWQWWHLMSDVHQVGTVDEEAFAAAAPCETEALLGSIAWDAIVEGVDNVEGAWEAECVIEE
jgi:hypothetical protein